VCALLTASITQVLIKNFICDTGLHLNAYNELLLLILSKKYVFIIIANDRLLLKVLCFIMKRFPIHRFCSDVA
jgi:hypothetical protein